MGVEVLVGRCTEGAGVAYEPFVEALRIDADATPDERLADRLGRRAGELARLSPVIAERTGRQPPPSSGSPELDQHRLFDAVAEWLVAASSYEPLMVALEDLHAAGRPTLLLRHVVRATAHSPLLLVATYRDTAEETSAELTESLADLVRHPGVAELTLRGLDRHAVAELLGAHHRGFTAEPGWADAVHAATAGNPLFVEELLAAWDDHQPASPQQLRRHPTASSGVRHLLDARVQRLASPTVELLQHAAVAGDRFEFAEVAAAARLGEEEALDALEEATASRLVTAAATGEGRYQFVHAGDRAEAERVTHQAADRAAHHGQPGLLHEASTIGLGMVMASR